MGRLGYWGKVAAMCGAGLPDRAAAARLGRTLGAQSYAQIVTIAVQLGLVPVLLSVWGVRGYGTWLLLSAIPAYLSFSDLGFTFVAKNEMVMAVARGQRDAAVATFQSIFALLCVGAPLLLVASAIGAGSVDLPALLSLKRGDGAAEQCALVLLIGTVLVYQFFLLVCAGIRAENRPASEAMWAASGRLAEGAAIGGAALAGGGFVAAAAGGLAMRIALTIGAYRWLRRRTAWLRLGFAAARRGEIARLWRPAIAYTAMPVAQALLIQGPVLIVGALLGPASVVVLATSRTLARLGTAATNMVNNSFVSEYSALAGAGAASAFDRLVRVQLGATAAIVSGYALVVLATAPFALGLLTHGRVAMAQPFFALLVLSVVAEMLWSALFTPISATNQHAAVTPIFIALSGAALLATAPLIAHLGVSGAAIALLAAHGAMIPVTWHRLRQTRA
ncbi:teichoic acid transporter [Sphingomonas sp. NBWT7]|uniref:lipopolysaccharide biosynthesis protein n=1 Tax=Sphingomonas sp. NBWT7 TaxID=2596913 RepID=UPI001625AC32|nr:teichoic acid transporter [Sphingomonas sp. NBWT7]QNE32734.1 teichoic acid transporter [Sphingomonas sp. NBWT7]